MILRKIQIDVLEQIKAALSKGKTDIFVQAPTGTGKSLIALELSRICNDSGFSSFILTSDRSLQSQYEEDCNGKFASFHSDVVSISGMDSYTCHVNGEKFSQGVCKGLGITNSNAIKTLACASTCEYLKRWNAASKSNRVVMNYSYWLLQMNYVYENLGDISAFAPRDLIICDEAHKIPDIVSDHFSCFIPRKLVGRINDACINLVKSNDNIMACVDTTDLEQEIRAIYKVSIDADVKIHGQHLERIYDALTTVNDAAQTLKTTLMSKYGKDKKASAIHRWASTVPRDVKRWFQISDQIKDTHCKLQDYVVAFRDKGLDDMVVCQDEDSDRTYHDICDSHLFGKHIQKYSKARIYLSATCQPDLLIERWNLDIKDVHIIDVNPGWDKNNSPVVLMDVAPMSYAAGMSSIMSGVSTIDSILEEHKDDRGCIHTTTNEIARIIKNSCKSPKRIYTYSSTAEKIELLNSLESLPNDAVLVGPSLYTGIDLPDDYGRFNVVMKLSFPNMGNRLWEKRYTSHRNIYYGETAAVLEQSAGRTTRHATDHSVTYILDSRARSFINGSKRFFSNTFIERLV